MSEFVPVAAYLTKRGATWQFCKRVPADLVAEVGRERIQFTLRTTSPTEAKRLGLPHEEQWEARFAALRAARGLATETPMAGALDTTRWTADDWDALARWYQTTLESEDLGRRRAVATGHHFVSQRMPCLDEVAQREVDRHEVALRRMTVAEFARERGPVIQRYHLTRLGIRLVLGSEHYELFMAACLRAELAVCRTFALRQSGKGSWDDAHPDSVPGPWKRPDTITFREASDKPAQAGRPIGRSLRDCLDRWKAQRVEAKKPLNRHLLNDMEATFERFRKQSGLNDIGEIRRSHVVAFRKHLRAESGYGIATLNKKIGFLLSMSKIAKGEAWIEDDLGTGYYIDVPADEGTREPYDGDDLARIFGHPLFTEGWRKRSVKGLGEFQFWMPLISATHGLITTEVGQLGPATVRPHPDAKDVLIFDVTTAGGRTVKTYARRRAIPIRRELLDLGLMDLVEAARKSGARTLWPEAEEVGWPLASNYFSAFWTKFADDLGGAVSADDKSLYSLRHAFQDAVESGEHSYLTKRLMGHAAGGMTDRYGRKKQPRAAPVMEMREAIQGLPWPWLSKVRSRP